ncbi:DUF2474 family protein [Ramlibacter sp. 2FC]|uniref:DUF2474 family protein n=1 Tax=Ramlibacter sp. 2FC TaxID=2502188 RepID=UPI0010F75FEB|nr:DUF2474 family protein [Ramlibacter sp. 2FC]
MGDSPAPPRPGTGLWRRRLAWLLGLWLAGVLALGAVAYGLRWLMRLLGLTP